MIDQNTVYEHWMSCLTSRVAVRTEHEAFARAVVEKYPMWELREVPVAEILSYAGTPLEYDGFFEARVEKYLKDFGGIDSMPALVLVPLDRNEPKLWLESKYSDPNIVWEPADGTHRIMEAHKSGAKTVLCYVPKEAA